MTTCDPNAALSAATDEFWRHGFAGTSMMDLAAAMSMTGPCCYQTYGDKRYPFKVRLDYYLTNYVRLRIAELDESQDPIDGLRAFFDGLVDTSLSDVHGCLLVNSAIDLATWDQEIAETIRSCLGEIEDGFHRAISRTYYAKSNDPRIAAHMLLSAVISLRLVARAGGDEGRMRAIAHSALSAVSSPIFSNFGSPQRAKRN